MRIRRQLPALLSAAALVFGASQLNAQNHAGMPGMSTPMTSPLGVPMDRLGSGTTWIPDAVSIPSRRGMAGGWELMLHGFLFAQYDKQLGPRGDDQFGSLNWAMLMPSRDLGGGRFLTRVMLSLDPATVGNSGYPLLLQTGETHRGQPLRDRQHPHDFWMELAAQYERALTSSLGLVLYAAPAGEPALGPVAFMHRPSAMDDLVAPLSHHWHDATHISFGVLTAGLFGTRWKLEGSAFNGREPNEKRWDFDRMRLDSYSGRFTINPDSQWSMALGHGYLKSPEVLHPDESTHRTTASILHGRRLGNDGQWATAAVWGGNRHEGAHRLTHAFLLESEAVLDARNTVFGRAEIVQKTAADLVLPATFDEDRRFNVGHISLGYIREIARTRSATLGLGVRGTLNVVPGELEPVYESRTPLGFLVFVRLRPRHSGPMSSMPGMRMNDHRGHQ
ncbi:MAG: hypothetical protein ACT4P6_21995 [Gemmatimonadaceae bacterium]